MKDKNQINGYLAQDPKGTILWAGGAKNDQEALSYCIQALGEKTRWTLIHIRLVTRAVVHEHVEVYTNDGDPQFFDPLQYDPYEKLSKQMENKQAGAKIDAQSDPFTLTDAKATFEAIEANQQ